MASPYEQRIDDVQNVPATGVEKDDITATTQEIITADGTEKSEDERGSEDLSKTQGISMELDSALESGKSLLTEGDISDNEASRQSIVENTGANVDFSPKEKVDKELKDDGLENQKVLDEPSFMSMVKGSDSNNKIGENEEAELLSLDGIDKRETENIDEDSEKALLTESDAIDHISHKMDDGEEENVDISEPFASEKLQQPQHFGEKEVSDSRNDADSEVEMEMKRANTMHLPESVFNIDEETRMGLDQTPSESCMVSSLITPLPPKKLFHLDDTKDSVDSETKLSTNTDTEDIRLRNTISVDQENTKDSVASDSVTEGPTPSKRMKGYREGLGDVIGETKHFTAENLFEYQWPQDGGEWHMLQEQISEFLKVKSFKRKYPDLYRRVCDKEEKVFLREKGVVTETQSDLGLTALRSEEVYDLMMKDYNDRYQEYLAVLQEKQKRVMREKHKEYGVAKLDKSKMEAYSKKAARWAAEFNASLMREKREERQAYFDLQTYTIHHTKKTFRPLPPEKTKIGSYPVALITGQYQDKFRCYQPDELRNFPLKTALTDPPPRVKYLLKPPASLMKPVDPPVVEIPDVEVKANGNDDTESQEEDKGKENISNNDQEAAEVSSLVVEPEQTDTTFKFDKRGKLVSAKKLSKGAKLSATPEKGRKLLGGKKKEEVNEEEGAADGDKNAPKQIHGLEKCRICKQRSSKEDRMKDRLIRCAQCHKIGHMSCLDLTDDLVAVIKTYPWQCMECKTCVQCMDPYDEDKMMFCDRCDRGYHTFCIGLGALPTGHWECRSCVDRKPDELPGAEGREEINSHNVIKDENQDSQDSIKDAVKTPTKWSKEILDPKPLSENELTTEYLMRLAGRNLNWRKDTGSEDPEPVLSPPSTPATVTPATSPVVKKEKSTVKRKKSEMSLNPTRSRPDRATGARQSKRIKAREEDEEKKADDEEPKKEKIGKKARAAQLTEAGDNVADSGVKDEKAEVEEGVNDTDKGVDEVVEGVDDSEVMMFEKNDEEQVKEEKDDGDDKEEVDDLAKEEPEVAKEEKDSLIQEGEKIEEDVTKLEKMENDEEVQKEGEEPEKAEEMSVQNIDEEETASAADKLLELIDGPSVEMEQEPTLSAVDHRTQEVGDLESDVVMQDNTVEGVESTDLKLENGQTCSQGGEDENADQNDEKEATSSDMNTDTVPEDSSQFRDGIESQQASVSSTEGPSQLSSSVSTVTELTAETSDITPVATETPPASTSEPAAPPTSEPAAPPTSEPAAPPSEPAAPPSEPAAPPISELATPSTNEPAPPSTREPAPSSASTSPSSSSPSALETETTTPQESKTDPHSSSSSPTPSPSEIPSPSIIPVSSIPLPASTTTSSTIPVSDIPLPPSPPPPSTTTSQPAIDIDPSTIPLPMDTD